MLIHFSKIIQEVTTLPNLHIPIGVNLNTSNPVCINLEENPHSLIAGISGFGKSSLVNVIFASIRLRSKDIRLVYLNPLSFNSKKLFPTSVEEFGADEIDKQLKQEVTRMESLYEANPVHTILVIDECSLVCEDRTNTLYIEAIAKTGRHSNYCLFILTQFPTLQSFGNSSLIKQNLHNQIVFRCGDSIRATHSVLAKDISADKLYQKGECFIRTPNILANYGKPLHCQAFYLPSNNLSKYIPNNEADNEALEQKENSWLTKDMLNNILTFLKDHKYISGQDIRKILKCQNPLAQKVMTLLLERGILIQAESKTGKCKLNNEIDLNLDLNLTWILDNSSKETETLNSSPKSNIINFEPYLKRR